MASNGPVGAVTTGGGWLWSFQPDSLGVPNPQFVSAGPYLIAYGWAQPEGGRIAVVDRSGAVVARSSYNSPAVIIPDPSGTQWAWVNISSNVYSLWVGGLDQAPREIKSWSEPSGYELTVPQWSDEGIVLLRVYTACGVETPEGSSLFDPVTGVETPLFAAGQTPLDVHAGVHVAMAVVDGSSPSSVSWSLYLAGSASGTYQYDLPIRKAAVSPDGSHVEVSMMGEMGCGGGPAETATDLIDLATGAQTRLPGFFADGWLDDDHLLGSTVTATSGNPAGGVRSTDIQISDMGGQVHNVVIGELVGVLH